MSDNTFGFSVTKAPIWSDDNPGNTWYDKHQKTREMGWSVYLPHQCDEWDIAGEDGEGVSREEAIDRLTAFIREASEALNLLVEEKEL